MLKPYDKKSDLSYSLGVAPTIELLENKPANVVKVILSPKGTQNTGISKIIKKCEELNIPLETNQKMVEKLSSSENTYAIGVFTKYSSPISQNTNHLVLVNPSDMGNLGTICRTMLAFNFTDLAIIRPAADVFDPKVIRSSMGAVFGLNFEYFETFEDYQTKFKNNLYPFMGEGKISLTKANFKAPYSLIFGNEGDGLDSKFREIGESVKIPQSDKVDSFNLSVAVGISLYFARNS